MILLRVWFTARLWREVAYLLVGVVWRAPAFALSLLGVAAIPLSVVIFGLALLAGVLLGARRTPAYFRLPARRILGWDWPDPPAARLRLVDLFGDGTAWRALGYCFAGFWVIYVGAYGLVVGFGSGMAALTYPAWWFVADNPFGSLDAHTWPQTWLEAGRGTLLLMALPWFVRLVVWLDSRLVRGLLHPTRAQLRIAQLEAGRAALQADSAALLRRVERDLHDGTQARLVTLGVALARVQNKSTEQQVRDLAAEARRTVTEALAELRDIVRGLHPPALDDGLEVALSTLAGRSAVPAEVTVALNGRPPDATASAIYFTVAELLTNIARHAHAGRCSITLTDDADRLTLTVRDDGRGGATIGGATVGGGRGELAVGGGSMGVAAGGGSGLDGLARRAAALDGELTVTSPAGGPTVVAMTLPREY